jgi:UDP-N-acetylmuramyl pentapeptide phosphotransferase/UDP-N-acetylglucosamine-1-phosphate transferase
MYLYIRIHLCTSFILLPLIDILRIHGYVYTCIYIYIHMYIYIYRDIDLRMLRSHMTKEFRDQFDSGLIQYLTGMYLCTYLCIFICVNSVNVMCTYTWKNTFECIYMTKEFRDQFDWINSVSNRYIFKCTFWIFICVNSVNVMCIYTWKNTFECIYMTKEFRDQFDWINSVSKRYIFKCTFWIFICVNSVNVMCI